MTSDLRLRISLLCLRLAVALVFAVWVALSLPRDLDTLGTVHGSR